MNAHISQTHKTEKVSASFLLLEVYFTFSAWRFYSGPFALCNFDNSVNILVFLPECQNTYDLSYLLWP